jgi:hypothetical protein
MTKKKIIYILLILLFVNINELFLHLLFCFEFQLDYLHVVSLSCQAFPLHSETMWPRYGILLEVYQMEIGHVTALSRTTGSWRSLGP